MNCPGGKEWKQQQGNLLNGTLQRQQVLRRCRPQLYALRMFLLVFVGSVHLMSATASFADCPWPSWQVVEHEDSQTSVVRGVPFTSHYHSWQVPHYTIDQFHCETNIATGPRSWSFQAGPDQDSKANSSIDSSTDNNGVKQSVPLALSPVAPLAEFPHGTEHGTELTRGSKLQPLPELPNKALNTALNKAPKPSPLLPVKSVGALQELPAEQKSLSPLSPLSPLQSQ